MLMWRREGRREEKQAYSQLRHKNQESLGER
jgi:hypothetical protein